MQVIGRGPFSTVYKREDIAVKVIDLDFVKPPHDTKSELTALKMLDHPNIIDLIKAETTSGLDPECRLEFPYYEFTLEHVLFAHSKANFPPGSGWRNKLEIEAVREIGIKLANAIAYIHNQGIIHRDIKPENILFKSTLVFEPVLIDFGIAWVPGMGEHPKILDVSSSVYKAPELLLGVEDYDGAIDIWSLACVLAKLLSPKSMDLFGEYFGDIGLLGTQMCVLGAPELSKCSSIASKAASWSPNQDLSERVNSLRGFQNVLRKMLNWEMTLRPKAVEVATLLSSA